MNDKTGNPEIYEKRLQDLADRIAAQELAMRETHAFITELVESFCSRAERHDVAINGLSAQTCKDKSELLRAILQIQEKLEPAFDRIFPGVQRFNEEVHAVFRRKRPPSDAD